MKTNVLLWVQLALAAMLLWTCFCRLVKTGPDTHREVRWAILFEGLAGGLVFLAPALPVLMPHEMHWRAGTTPAGVWIVLLLAVTLVQIVTAKYWAHGQAPAQFQKSPKFGGAAFAMALLALGFVSAGSTPAVAQQRDQVPNLPFTLMPPGAIGKCMDSGGCAAMPLSDLLQLLDAAEASGRADCPRKPTLL